MEAATAEGSGSRWTPNWTTFAGQGFEAIGNSPEEFAAIIKSEIPTWAKVIKEAAIKPD